MTEHFVFCFMKLEDVQAKKKADLELKMSDLKDLVMEEQPEVNR